MLVSIIVPYRNPGDLLGQALRSALGQTHAEVEVLAIDDGSTDGSAAIANAMADARLRCLQTGGLGVCAARNLGLREARGAFVQFLDGDDLLHPEKIERQLAVLRDEPDTALAVGCLQVFRDLDDPAQGELRTPPVGPGLDDPLRFQLALLGADGRAQLAQVGQWLAPRALLDSAGPWDESLIQSTDIEYFVRVGLAASRIHICTDAIAWYRRLAAGGSLRDARDRAALASSLDATDRIVAHLRGHRDAAEYRDEIDAAAATLYRRRYLMAWPAQPRLSRRARLRLTELGKPLAPLPLDEVGLDPQRDAGSWRRMLLRRFAKTRGRALLRRVLGTEPAPRASAWRYRQPTTTSQVEALDRWNEILPIPARSIEDTFEECGGDPSHAERLIEALASSCGIRISEITPDDTVESLAWRLSHAAAAEERERIHTLPTAATDPGLPLVFLHGDLNGARCWVDAFTSRLGEERTIHLVEPPDFTRPEECSDAGSAASAAVLLEPLAEKIGKGPILLGGYCNGSIMAHELACQLRARGIEVPAVIALDVALPNASLRRLRGIFERWSHRKGLSLREQTAQLAGWHRTVQEWLVRWILLTRQRSDFVILAAGQPQRFRSDLQSRIRRYLGMRFGSAATSAIGSIPQYFDGRVVHFHAQQRPLRRPIPPRRSWKKASREFVKLRGPGDHATCITRHQDELLAVLLPELHRLDREAGRRPHG